MPGDAAMRNYPAVAAHPARLEAPFVFRKISRSSSRRREAVIVPMVEVGIVRVLVPHRLVPVPMRMRFCHRSVMVVLMMAVVDVAVFMLQRLVAMLVVMPLGQM